MSDDSKESKESREHAAAESVNESPDGDNIVPLAASDRIEGASGSSAHAPQPVSPQDRHEQLRMLEALLFASSEPLSEAVLAKHLPDGIDIRRLLEDLQQAYASRGVNLCIANGRWSFRTAEDLGFLLQRNVQEERKLSRAALETLAIIAYHQPATRAEIEEIRGVSVHRGTLDILLETGWIRIRGRRKVPGRPVTFGTTDAFLDHFSLEAIGDLPGVNELKDAGLLDSAVPADFTLPRPDGEMFVGEQAASANTDTEDANHNARDG